MDLVQLARPAQQALDLGDVHNGQLGSGQGRDSSEVHQGADHQAGLPRAAGNLDRLSHRPALGPGQFGSHGHPTGLGQCLGRLFPAQQPQTLPRSRRKEIDAHHFQEQ